MKTNSISNSSAFALVLTIFIALISVINFSCNKMDVVKVTNIEIENRFFNISTQTPDILKKVVSALKKQNEIGHFIPEFAKNDGYAYWDKSIIKKSSNNQVSYSNRNDRFTDAIVITPIIQEDSGFVNGFFLSKVAGDSVELHLYRANDFDLHPYGSEDSTFVTADRIANQVALLNYNVFGYQKFLINDTLLFKKYFKLPSNGDTRTLSLKVATPQNGNAVYCQVLNPSSCVGMSPEDLCVVCYQVNIIVVSNDPDIPYNWPPDAPLPTGGGGSGGGGSGNTGNPPPTNNCTSNNQCQQLRSLIVEGRLPCGGCGTGPITTMNPLPPIDIPVDSIPKIISLAADREMDSLYLWGMNNDFREQSFIVVKKNSQIYPKNCNPGFTSGDKTRVNYTLEPVEELLAYGHIHAEDTTNFWRTSFSPEDLIEFNEKATKIGYTAILEVGNARYAFVLEDIPKKSAFNINRRGNHVKLYSDLFDTLSNQFSNGQILTEQTWIQYLGSSSTSGIGFYKSTAPNKNNFTKLNP